MRFKQYLLKEIQLIDERFEIKYKDSSIKKIDKYNYEFQVDGINYLVNALEVFPDWYSIQFGRINEKGFFIQTGYKTSITNTYKVFNKVITSLIYFIKENDPYRMDFSTDDKKLKKLYGSLIPKIQLYEPFFKYEIIVRNQHGWSYTFLKKENLTEGYRKKEFEKVTNEI